MSELERFFKIHLTKCIVSKLKKIHNLYFLMVLVYIILFLNPEILIEVDFAEEGSVFWSYALANSTLETLFFVPVTGITCSLMQTFKFIIYLFP